MKKSFVFSMAIMASGIAMAQSTPTHPLDIGGLDFPDGTFTQWFPAWVIGTPPMEISEMDDQFYISRTRPLPHISKENDVVDPNPDAPYERKFCGFYGADDPTATWKTLPRYCFEGDSYSMWAYTDMFSNWTAPFFRCTAGLSDVAARNGASVGVNWSIPWAARMTWNTSYRSNDYSKKMGMMCDKDSDGNFLYAEKIVRLMKYYGISALSFNSEFNANSDSMAILAEFFAECHRIAERIGWKFEVHWYGYTGDSGFSSSMTGLSGFKNIFGNKDNRSVDMLFINYGWGQSTLQSIPEAADELGRSSYDVFAGFDIQGRGLKNSTSNDGWQMLKDSQISISFWGAHKQNLIHESSNDYGTSDIAIQRAYLKKQELISNGGNNNPAVRPGIKGASLSLASCEGFHGLAELMRAKSSIQQLPFVSRFNIGNGLKFYNRGQVAFDSKWYNLGTQDFLPTWRWWITDANDAASSESLAGFVKAELVWDEAWFGGSCLSLSGATDFSRVKLFKTFLPAKANEEFSIVYKPVDSDDAHLKLFVSLKNDPTSYKEIKVPAGKKGEWNKFSAKLSELGVSEGDIVLMGLVVENTNSEYKTLVGEFALRDPAKTFAPVKPVVKEVEILRGRNNQVDFKMRYAAKEETGEEKTYNDEVDTWYYEIFIQQEGHEPTLVTATPSWAAYVIGAPIVSGFEGRNARFGVRAVSPNGDMFDNNQGDIAWSEYMEIPYNQIGTEIVVNKKVVKPNEKFILSYADDMAPAPQKWEILNAVSGDLVSSATDKAQLETSLPDVGVYDVRVTTDEGETMLRAKIQVTPAATGRTPEVTMLMATQPKVETGADANFMYAVDKGEGSVSRAVRVADPQMLQIPGDIQVGKTYSYALWFKADAFAHLSNGTNLISKNTVEVGWPHNNWGDIWVQIRPEGQGYANVFGDDAGKGGKCGANEISFNTMGWTAHQQAYGPMLAKGYTIEPGSWNHVVVTHDDDNNQCIYINGKLAASACCSWSTRRYDSGNIVANIHIGGAGVYKAAFNGLIDEVQVWTKTLSPSEVRKAMLGYKEGEVPEGLAGYYTFETLNADGTFPNLGKAGADKTAKIVVTKDAGGENTSGASYVQQEADNSDLGNPGVEGSLPVVTTTEWKLNGGTLKSDNGSIATVVYGDPGKYDITLVATNGWGSDEYTLPEAIEVTGTSALDDIAADGDLLVASDNGIVSFRFAEAGEYGINIITLDGRTVQSEVVSAEAGSTATVALNAAKGVYLVQVILNGNQVKVVKVLK